MNRTQVAIVRHVSECDVQPVPGYPPMPYDDAVAELAAIATASPRSLARYDLVYVQDDGTLGRCASWALPTTAARDRYMANCRRNTTPITITFGGQL